MALLAQKAWMTRTLVASPTGLKVVALKWLISAACLLLLSSHPAAALDQVSLQLKWKHQFQFAGYYAALEQGFYRDAGLDVAIREGGPGIAVAETVASSMSDLRGHTLMDTPGSDEIAAMLKQEGVDYATLPRIDHRGDPRDLLVGRADAMVAYSTNKPFILEQLGAAYR